MGGYARLRIAPGDAGGGGARLGWARHQPAGRAPIFLGACGGVPGRDGASPAQAGTAAGAPLCVCDPQTQLGRSVM